MLLPKDKWSEFTGRLSGKNLWAPALQGGMKKFAPVGEGDAVTLEEGNTTVPPRRCSFPRRRRSSASQRERKVWSSPPSMKRPS